MAALQTIRSKGALLLIIIGVALFAFIAEEFVRSIQTTTNERRQVAGEVCGKKLTSLDFQHMVEDYKDALKFMRGSNTLTEQESAQAEDFVWQSYVNYQLISKECEKLGLTVTDSELQDELNRGNNPMLTQTPFVNQEGRFDVNALKNFLTEYQKIQNNTSEVPEQYIEQYTLVFKYWKFIEKTLRENILEQKYQVLLANTILSNPVEAKNQFENNTLSSDILIASVNYRSIPQDKIKIEESDLKAKYNELKERFRQYVESRDIRFVQFVVEASDQDKKELDEEMAKYAEKLATTDDPVSVVRMSNSQIFYNHLWTSKAAFPGDIQNKLDSISIGMTGPYYEIADNSENIIKYFGSIQAPDSILCRTIQVGGATVEEARKSADSIYAAIQAGANFDSIAHKYKQQAPEQWLVSNQYETAPNLDENNVKLFNTLNTTAVNELKNIEFETGNIIALVTDRRAMTTKYDVAIIKRPVTFSKETYAQASKNFNQYLASSPTMEELEKNAVKYGYQYQMNVETYSNAHFINNIPNSKEALRWLFNEDTKEGEISQLYECGDNNTLLVVALNKIHKEGYLPLKDVKNNVEKEVEKDKKAEYILKDPATSKIKSIADAKAQGLNIDTLKAVSFNGNAYIPATGTLEGRINGSIVNKKVNDFVGPIKGEGGIYFYQVIANNKDSEAKYKEEDQMNIARTQHLRAIQSFGSDLFLKGNVKDKRYLFF